jgi:hypothetical protein
MATVHSLMPRRYLGACCWHRGRCRCQGLTGTQLANLNSGLIPADFIRGNNGETTLVPKAYIKYIFFDEQFKYVGGNYSRVGASEQVESNWKVDKAALKDIRCLKTDIYMYVSNESNLDVYFNKFEVIHKVGPLLTEISAIATCY